MNLFANQSHLCCSLQILRNWEIVKTWIHCFPHVKWYLYILKLFACIVSFFPKGLIWLTKLLFNQGSISITYWWDSVSNAVKPTGNRGFLYIKIGAHNQTKVCKEGPFPCTSQIIVTLHFMINHLLVCRWSAKT